MGTPRSQRKFQVSIKSRCQWNTNCYYMLTSVLMTALAYPAANNMN